MPTVARGNSTGGGINKNITKPVITRDSSTKGGTNNKKDTNSGRR